MSATPMTAPVTNATPGGATPPARNWQRPALGLGAAMRAAQARARADQPGVIHLTHQSGGPR